MRLALVSVAVLLASVAACAPAEEEDTDGAGQDLTGGSTTVESPIVFLFDGADTKLAPKCSGALISDTMAVTAKSCAKIGLTVGRAADDDGKGKRTTVKTLHLPADASAEIAVVELAASIGGQPAVITHAPLRDGYAINSWSSKDQPGVLNALKADKGEASSIGGRLVSETTTAATIVPDKGTSICATDIGAPVCSSTSSKILGWELRGTCGLSGLVVAAPEGTSSLTNAANGGCSDGAWKVATLGQHADFLKKLAPKAFQPIVPDGFLTKHLPAYVADGLWGYKSAGDVKQCKITTTNLTSIMANGVAKVSASVSFAGMQERATPYGRFGIAPKATPDQMTWFGAKTTKTGKGAAFDATFEGTVGAAADGEYVVAFRASGSGGESWTLCDTSGVTTKLTADKTLPLLVGDAKSTTTLPTTGASTSATTGTTTSAEYSDPATDLPSSDTESDPNALPVAKKQTAAGCSAAAGNGASSPLSLAGILLGLAAVVRRRKK